MCGSRRRMQPARKTAGQARRFIDSNMNYFATSWKIFHSSNAGSYPDEVLCPASRPTFTVFGRSMAMGSCVDQLVPSVLAEP